MFCVLVAALTFALPAASDAVAPVPVASSAATIVVHHQRAVGSLVVDALLSTADPVAADVAITAAVAEIARVQTLFAPVGGGLVGLENAVGDAVTVEPEVFAVLVDVQRISRLSKGAFDPTAAAYNDVWAFDAAVGSVRTLPGAAVLAEKKAVVGVDMLVLDPVRRTARLKATGVRVDVSDVAIGYALDRARGVLIDADVAGFVLSIDGNVVGHGLKGDTPWMVGVQDPRGPGPFVTLPLDEKGFGGAVMTVSDNDGSFMVGTVRQHRHLDPRTGQPARVARSVTVVHSDALTAACLARAAFVLGAKDGIALVERVKANVIVVGVDNSVSMSKGLKKLAAAHVLLQRAPTDSP